ncbi:Anti-sigma-B factor antagonist [Rubrobacter xylanophilus DSM 9941]|uniref:STAS domain-containing protein n=1 Tax=Rubrobacter xylanophilus TaxID=49319 RepID=UPI001C63FAE2|nr:STAS domain-containing protein [Rubrobacter xylanophilus]QYJ15841.1 Anti-sigma-B factor antagonist [Rubrobacter xylanophilus DSM 9941]
MDFDVSIDEHAEEYSVISVRGEVDLHSSPKVKYAIQRAAGRSPTVVVDMSGIEFMDSTALSMFARTKDELAERGVALRLATPSEAVDRIFGITGFRDYFEIFASREEALLGRPPDDRQSPA